MASKRRMEFEYEARTDEDIRKHQSASTGRTGYIVEGTKIFTPKAGNHTFRILPPTWPDKKTYGKYFGIDVYAHYNIGPDGSSFLCLAKMGRGACPICEERKKAVDASDDDLAQQLRPSHRVACWVIDRNNEREGPELFLMPHSLDGEINKRLLDKRTGDVYNVDDPDEGYDIDFEREGDGLKTKYVAVEFARKPSPLSDDEEESAAWIEVAVESPIPDLLVFQDEDYLRDIIGDGLVFSSDAKRGRGTSGKRRDDDDDRRPSKPSRPRPNSMRDEDEDESEKPKKKPSRDDDDPPFEEDKPKKRSSRDEDEDETPKGKKSSRDEDEDEKDPEDEDEKESLKDRLKKIRNKAAK